MAYDPMASMLYLLPLPYHLPQQHAYVYQTKCPGCLQIKG